MLTPADPIALRDELIAALRRRVAVLERRLVATRDIVRPTQAELTESWAAVDAAERALAEAPAERRVAACVVEIGMAPGEESHRGAVTLWLAPEDLPAAEGPAVLVLPWRAP